MQIISAKEAVALVKDGDSIGFSGFLDVANPLRLFEELGKTETKDLTLCSVVLSYPLREGVFLDKLFENNQVKKFIGAHTGTSKTAVKKYLGGEVEVDYIPMGTLAECLWAGGAGLGGVITPTGVGTEQEENHEKIVRNGKEYLIYDPIRLDVAFIKATKADKFGNIVCRGTTKSISRELALCSDLVIVEVEEIVETGELDPSDIWITGNLVDYVVEGYTREESVAYYEELWQATGQLREED